MYSRNVTMHLKPKSVAEFTRTIENEVLPVLRKQKGFQDELTFVDPNETEALGISLWDSKANADAYDRATYPQVLKALSKVIDGKPQVRTYDVCNSTFHKIAAHVAV
jgi:quinol monooxygenase YgiN